MTLAPLAGGTGLRALRLVDAEGVAYWLEFRAATGRDAWLGTRDNVYRLDAGVLLRRTGQFPDTSLLLDGTPGPAGRWESDLQFALPAGVPVPLSGGDFTLTVRGVDAGGAVVDVLPASRPAPAAAAAPEPAGEGSGPRLGAVAGSAVGDAEPAAIPAPAATSQAPVPWAPAVSLSVRQPSVTLEPVADSSSSFGGLLLLGAGAALAGSALLLLQALRRHRLHG